MGNSESNESAAVKRQAEGGSVPMYELLGMIHTKKINPVCTSSFKGGGKVVKVVQLAG